MLDDLYPSIVTGDIGLTYYYFDSPNWGQHSPTNIISTLMKQLIAQRTDQLQSVHGLTERFKRDESLPEADELARIFYRVCEQFSCVYIIIDALDECHVDEDRNLILGFLQRLDMSKTRLFVTTRSPPRGIKQTLGPYTSIPIEAEASDIRAHLNRRIDENDSMRELIDLPLREEVVTEIINSAHGMLVCR